MISAFLVCVDNHKRETEWSREEWRFSLDDVFARLRPGGRLYLGLDANPERYGTLTWYDPPTRDLFASRGSVKGNAVLVERPA